MAARACGVGGVNANHTEEEVDGYPFGNDGVRVTGDNPSAAEDDAAPGRRLDPGGYDRDADHREHAGHHEQTAAVPRRGEAVFAEAKWSGA